MVSPIIYFSVLSFTLAAPAPWINKWLPGSGGGGGYSIIQGCDQQTVTVTVTVGYPSVITQSAIQINSVPTISNQLSFEQGVQPVVFTNYLATTVNGDPASAASIDISENTGLQSVIGGYPSYLQSLQTAVGSVLPAIESTIAGVAPSFSTIIASGLAQVTSRAEGTTISGVVGSQSAGDILPATANFAATTSFATTVSDSLLSYATSATVPLATSSLTETSQPITVPAATASDIGTTSEGVGAETEALLVGSQTSSAPALDVAKRADAPMISIIATTINLGGLDIGSGTAAAVATAATAALGLFQGLESAAVNGLSALVPSQASSGSSDAVSSLESAVSGGLGDLLGSSSSSDTADSTSDAVSSVESAVTGALGDTGGDSSDLSDWAGDLTSDLSDAGSGLGDLSSDLGSDLSSVGSSLGDLADFKKRQNSPPSTSWKENQLKYIPHTVFSLSEDNGKESDEHKRADPIGDGVASILNAVAEGLPSPASQIVNTVGDGIEAGFDAGGQIASAVIALATAAAN